MKAPQSPPTISATASFDPAASRANAPPSPSGPAAGVAPSLTTTPPKLALDKKDKEVDEAESFSDFNFWSRPTMLPPPRAGS